MPFTHQQRALEKMCSPYTKICRKTGVLSVKPRTVYIKQLLNPLWFVLKAKLLQKPNKFYH